MAKQKHRQTATRKRVPKVRIARPSYRSYQLRYVCPHSKREIRISTETRDEGEAERQKKQLEATLLLGIPMDKKVVVGPNMAWEDFREQYTDLHLATLEAKSALAAESRLDIAERILKPKALVDIADSGVLHRLQMQLLAGAESRFGRARSPHTVRGYIKTVLAAISWAHLQGWVDSVPRVRTIKTSKLKHMKGRALTSKEFKLMLKTTVQVTGKEAKPSWRYVLHGLWESALRLDELMHVSWDIPGTIQPEWKKGKQPVLQIPASMQKNATEESIPLLPGFEKVLLKTPKAKRTGWVFNPLSLQLRLGRPVKTDRSNSEWVGKVISKIGKKAGIQVDPGDEATEKPPKYASSHDLRRSCAERLLEAGLPPLVISRILRHASWETTKRHYASGNVQRDAGIIRELLAGNEN